MAPRINFSQVSISLAQFQEVSTGELNIGEVRLTSEHTIRRVNHHATWKSQNNVSLSHEEVLAIKNAFVKALSKSGVQTNELNTIRQELGLSPMKPVDKTFHERSMKPLSRQQIREILDRNAGTINHAVGEGTIRTTGELFGGVSEQTLAARRAQRDAVNAELSTRRNTVENESITTLQSILAGDVDFIPFNRLEETLTMARMCLDAVLQSSNMAPSPERKACIQWNNSGQSVKFSTGLTELEFVRKLEDMIVRLGRGQAPSDRQMAIRDEFKALATNEDRTAWAANLANAPQGALKARVVAVMIMHDRGIIDAETLSVVNKLNDENAIAFVSGLIANGMELEGDALRQSEAVQTALHNVDPNFQTGEFGNAYIPALTNAEYNETIASFLNCHTEKLPATFQRLVEEASNTVRARFGDDVYGEDASPSWHLTGASATALTGATDPNAPRITAETLHDSYMTSALNAAAKRLFEAGVKARLDDAGLKVNYLANVAWALRARHPEIMTQIHTAQSADAAKAVLDNYIGELPEIVRRTTTIERCQKTLPGWAREAISKKLGVSPNSLSSDDFNTANLAAKGNALRDAIGAGTNPANTDEEIEKAFKDLVDKFVDERVKFLDKIEKLDIPPDPKDALKTLILKMDKVHYVDIDAIVAAANKISTDELAKCFADKAPDEDIFKAMTEITRVATDEMLKRFGDKIGPDEQANIMAPILFVAILSKPSLERPLSAFLSSNAVAGQEYYYEDNPAHPAMNFMDFLMKPGTSTGLAEKLGTDQLPPYHAKALVDAAREEGYGELTIDEAISMFSPGKYVGDTLKLFVESAESAFRATFFKALARSALRSYKEAVAKATHNMEMVGKISQAFMEGTGEERALAAGYAKAEVPRIAKTFAFYKVGLNVADEVALEAALDPNSNASRLVAYGGRFTESVGDFLKGLELLKSFDGWFAKTFDNAYADKPTTVTETLMHTSIVSKDAGRALESFLFEEIALNKDIPLDIKNPEKVFGMENNPAMRFIGNGYTTSCAHSLAQIPPAKRQLVYAVFDALDPLPKDGKVSKKRDNVQQSALLLARIMKNYDAVAKLRDEGKLTRENLVPLLYRDVNVAPTATNGEISKVYNDLLLKDPLAGLAHMQMLESGTMMQETIEALRQGKHLPPAPCIATFNGHFEGIDGTAKEGRATMLTDLVRPTGATVKSKGTPIIDYNQAKYVVRFPDGTALESKKINGVKEDYDSANVIADKIADLCGAVHQKQLSAVFFALSQSAIGTKVDGAFHAHDIDTNEHMGLVFTFEKNNETGDIKIHFSQPEGFPIQFSWDTTVHVDGSSEATAMVMVPPPPQPPAA